MKKAILAFLCLLTAVVTKAQLSAAEKNETLQLVSANRTGLGLSADDVKNIAVTNTYVDPVSGIRYVYLIQTFKDLPVYNQMQILTFRSGKVMSNSGGRIKNIEQCANSTNGVPALSASAAVTAAIADRKFASTAVINHIAVQDDKGKLTFESKEISNEKITAELMWVPDSIGKKVSLAWQVFFVPKTTSDYWLVRIDALKGGTVGVSNLTVYDNWGDPEHAFKFQDTKIDAAQQSATSNTKAAVSPETVSNSVGSPSLVASATYRVIPFPAESPQAPGGVHALRTNPWTAAPGNATTLNWHTGAAGVNYNYSRGNNIWAYQDRANTNTGSLATSAPSTTTPDPLTFNYTPNYTVTPIQNTPVPNEQFNITNLFYWTNIVHDVMYQYGFTEPAANFQDDNLGRGGTGNDHVNAQAQDGSGTNNANFSTPADGGSGRMQMYLWDINGSVPSKDGDVDNGVIVHEFGHGISNRLTGGGTGTCLGNAEQMGEGWSDYYSMMFTQDWASANVNTGFNSPRGIGLYALNNGNLFGTSAPNTGIRHFKYCTDFTVNSQVYLATLPTSPHDRGEIWAATLWDMTWAIIQQENLITANIYDATSNGGNVIALKLVTEGLKLQPCNPGFIDGRDAIIQADINLYGGRHVCAIKEAFRRRGMGLNASQGSSNSVTDQVPSFIGDVSLTLLQNNVVSTPEGQNINYTNRLSTACAAITNYVIRDTLPANVTFVSATAGGSYNAANRVVSWTVSQAAGSSQDYNFVVSINAGSYFPPNTIINETVPSTTIPASWTASSTTVNVWTAHNLRSHSAPNSFFTPNAATVSDQILTTTASFSLPASPPELSFWHWYNSESTYDGGVVEISTNGGGTWADIGAGNFTQNGYNATIDGGFLSPIANRSAFSGNSNAFIQSKINMTPYANQANVKLRWRFGSDNGVSATGWNVDDIMLASVAKVEMRSSLFNASNVRLLLSDSIMIITAAVPACGPPVVLTCPTNTTTAACQTQAAVNAAFTTWLGTASGSGGLNGVLTNNNTGAPAACGGSTTVTFTYTTTCASPTTTCQATFTVTAAPTVVLTCPSNTTIASCQTQAAVNTAFATWLGTVSSSGGCGGVLTNNNTGAPSAAGGSATVTFTYTSSCAPTSTTCQAIFTVTPSPVIVLTCPVNTTTAACQTQAAVNTAFATWLGTASAGGGCSGALTNNNTGAPAACGGSTTVTFTYTSVTAPLVTTCQATFTVTAPSTVVLTCPVNTTTAAAQTQAAVNTAFATWLGTVVSSGGCGGTLTNNNTGAPASCGGSTTVTFTYTSSCAPTTTTCQATFTVPPSGVNTIATPATQTKCNGTAITTIALTGAVAGTTYNWTRDNNVNATGIAASGTGNISGTLTNAGTAPVTVTFTITPTANGCTGAAITAVVIVNPTAIVNAITNQVVCSATNTTAITFGTTATGGTTVYNWTNNTTSIGLAASGTGNIGSFAAVNNGTAPLTATITVTPVFTNASASCNGTPVTFTITVNPKATINAVTSQVLCNNSATTAVAFSSPTTGGTIVYNWTNSATSIGLAVSGTGTIPSFTAVNSSNAPVAATITVTPSYTNAAVTCTGTPITYTYTVNPVATLNTIGNQTLCNGAATTAVTFSSPATGGTIVYNWTNSTTSIGLAASGTGNIPVFTAVNTGSAAVVATITVTPSFTNGSVTCTGTASTFTYTINPSPVVTLAPFTLICSNAAPVTLSGGSPTTGGTGIYFVDNIVQTIFNPANYTAGVHTIMYQFTNSFGCVSSASQTITVSAVHTVQLFAGPNNNPVAPGQPVTLAAGVSPAGNYTYVWTKDNVLLPVPPTTDRILVTANDAGTYRVTVTSTAGCSVTSLLLFTGSQTQPNILYVFPNPTSTGIFYVAYNNGGNNLTGRTLNVYDSKESRVFTQTYSVNVPFGNMKVDISKYAAGQYYIMLLDSNGKTLGTTKLIKL